MQTYVLTTEQLTEAVARGAAALGIVPSEVTDDLAHCNFMQVVNGGVFTFFGARALTETAETTSPTADAPPEIDRAARRELKQIGDIKDALRIVMTRPPSNGTIRSWSPSQRKAAMKWAREDGAPESRPEHVQERAKRGSRGLEEPTAPATTGETAQNGSPPPATGAPTTSDGSNGSPAPSSRKSASAAPRSSKAAAAVTPTGSQAPNPGRSSADEEDDDEGGGSASKFLFDANSTD